MPDFHEFQPSTFLSTGGPLEVELWIVDMENLLKAIRILDDNRVDVVQIQLVDVAQT